MNMNELKSWSELSHLEQVACEFSDFYKDAHGFRPRHIDTSSWTLEDFDREFEVLADICKGNTARRVAEEAAAVTKFENRVSMLMTCGAKDRSMAIRWMPRQRNAMVIWNTCVSLLVYLTVILRSK
jgi:hypothetical protein